MAAEDELFIGVDGGGTKCKAVVYSEKDGILGEARSGPANPFQDFELATKSICEAAYQAVLQAGMCFRDMSNMRAGLGLAGVNIPDIMNKMQHWNSPFRSHVVTTDLNIALLGAHGGEDGAVIIAGTGSCGYAKVAEQSLLIGAHGFPHGDKGSGSWIGLKAVQHSLLVSDKLEQESALSRELKITDPIAFVKDLSGKPPRYYAKLAPAVFVAAAEHDPVAISILREAGDYLSAVARRLLTLNPPALSMIGGIADRITPWLAPDVSSAVCQAKLSPELGAILFLKSQEH
ncbi:N-acetylglucosamine kinase [Pleionea litopenaei]|uniref:BadF/BadG/BcrA/BcrD ATPase family protein n=1 Tax=Pleionea litopenaei TaxID=3070815 RepID=A0AA51RS92_9GAMM|nr:BadF/BadG/BcrA/BcrD ATPase family protein [Pleionea sp. HL-JVS1]WMS86656.1 BadF/BadG/BcrA/BcrD ATPase family protein [Pleionea sp. HL-JVS1]